LLLHYLEKYPVPAGIDRRTRRWIAKRGLYFAYLCRDREVARDELDTLKSLDGNLTLKDRLYYYGSHSIVSQMTVSAALFALRRLGSWRHSIRRPDSGSNLVPSEGPTA
jgi:hypothetical protein